MKFPFFVARRYLRTGGRQVVVSIATLISVAGVTAGVGALHIALALNEGMQQEFLSRILGATNHIHLRSLTGAIITDYRDLVEPLMEIPEVVSVSPTVSGYALLESRLREWPAIVKGVDLKGEEYAQVVSGVVAGSLDGFDDPQRSTIVLGKELAAIMGVQVGDRLLAVGTRGDISPLGRLPRYQRFDVIAIYATGLWDYDTTLALVSVPSAQAFFDYSGRQAVMIEMRIRDLNAAEEVAEVIRDSIGPEYQVQTWIELNRPLFAAFQVEKLVFGIGIGLIILVAALNIVSTLTLMVTQKNRDIAVINAMGGTPSVIYTIFSLQGAIIGLTGTVLGSVLGITISVILDRWKMIPLDPQIYQIPYVPFRVQWWDALLVAMFSILVSFLATLYPARSASKLDPIPALRNE